MTALKEILLSEINDNFDLNKKIPLVDYIKNQTKFNGARYLRECCMKLNASIITMCTAATYYHRFYSSVNFEDYDPYLIACTSIYLASKVRNDDLKIRDIINVGYHTLHHKDIPLSLDPYFELRDSLVEAELLLMRMLKFDLSVDLPLKYLLFFLNALKDWLGDTVFENFPILNISYTILLDSYHMSTILNYSPPAIAAAVIHLTLQIYGITVPASKALTTSPWFSVLHPDCKLADVLNITSELIVCYSLEKLLNYIL